jgi:hypothetical protein
MRVKEKLRYELKYVLTAEQAAAVRADLAGYVAPDEHGDAQGAYRITSLYYDTPDYRAYWDKLEGHKVRRKVRVRTYGDTVADGDVACYLEIKHRVNQRMGKRRARLPYAVATDFDALADRPPAVDEADWVVMQEVGFLYATLRLQAACIVRYDRLALNGDASHPDLRITFDTNLRGRARVLSLLAAEQPVGAEDPYFLPPDRCIMEIKVNQTAPFWLTQILSRHRCILRRVSKYCGALEQSAVIQNRQRIMVRQ